MAEGKPIAHYPLLCSVLHAKKAGYRYFNTDELDFTDEKTDKQNNIAFFKKGFITATRLEVHYCYAFDIRKHVEKI